jgi:hypothetical protein
MIESYGIFEYDREEDLDCEAILFHDVIFLEDFGVFKKGEKHSKVIMSYFEGYIETTDRKKEQEFLLEPKNEN